MRPPTQEEIADAVTRETLGGGAGEIYMEEVADVLAASPAAQKMIQDSVDAVLKAALILERQQGKVLRAAMESTILGELAAGVAIGMRIGQLRWCPETGARQLMRIPENTLLSEEERRTVREMLDAGVRHFRKQRAKVKRELEPRSVYKAFQEEAGNMLQEGADESASGQ